MINYILIKEFIKELKIRTVFDCKCISLSLKLTTHLARSLVLQAESRSRNFIRVKSNTSKLRRTLIFSSEKCEKRYVSNSR